MPHESQFDILFVLNENSIVLHSIESIVHPINLCVCVCVWGGGGQWGIETFCEFHLFHNGHKLIVFGRFYIRDNFITDFLQLFFYLHHLLPFNL